MRSALRPYDPDRDWWEDERDREWFGFPRDPEIGDAVANNAILYVWDGHKWTRANARSGPSQAPIVVSREAPRNALLGTLWFEPKDETLSIWVGRRWISIGGRGAYLSLAGGVVRGDVRVRGELVVDRFTIRPEEEDHHEEDRHEET